MGLPSFAQTFRIDLSQALDTNQARKLADPPGFSASIAKETDAATTSSRGGGTDAATLARRQQALFSVATSPVKNCAMMAFMMYMAGSQLHFFSIMATINGFYTPLNAILKSGLMFQPDPSGRLNVAVPRVIYCAIHAAGLAFALYRIHLMGLLPTHLSDWVAMVQAPPPAARTVTGLLRGPWA